MTVITSYSIHYTKLYEDLPPAEPSAPLVPVEGELAERAVPLEVAGAARLDDDSGDFDGARLRHFP